MRWASFVSEEPAPEVAIHQACAAIEQQLDGASPDLVMLFVSAHHAQDFPELPAMLRPRFPRSTIVGCSGGGVVGGGREVEHSAALSLTAASLPGVRLLPFHLDPDRSEKLAADPDSWRGFLGLEQPGDPYFVLLPDPYTCDARALIGSLDAAFPGAGKTGGMASGAQRPGDNALFIGDEVYPDGAVGVAIEGDVTMDTIVAQGCRPIGSPLFVTGAVRSRILELDGRRPTEVLAEIYESLDEDDRSLFRHSLFLGVVMRAGREDYGHGDFLIRNIVGLDGDTGVLAVGELIEPGQVVQLHLRDAEASARDLEQLLRGYRDGNDDRSLAGALLFSCLGRGERLYGEPDHDCRKINEVLGPLPIGGFFCNGEIGPVDRRTFLHGYTSSIAVFRGGRSSPEATP